MYEDHYRAKRLHPPVHPLDGYFNGIVQERQYVVVGHRRALDRDSEGIGAEVGLHEADKGGEGAGGSTEPTHGLDKTRRCAGDNAATGTWRELDKSEHTRRNQHVCCRICYRVSVKIYHGHVALIGPSRAVEHVLGAQQPRILSQRNLGRASLLVHNRPLLFADPNRSATWQQAKEVVCVVKGWCYRAGIGSLAKTLPRHSSRVGDENRETASRRSSEEQKAITEATNKTRR